MRHPALYAIGPLSQADDWQLENVVDLLVHEAETDTGMQVERAEALALLSHEFRRRGDDLGGVMARDNPLVTVVDQDDKSEPKA